MKIERVWSKDIYSFKDFDFNFQSGYDGTTMFLGKNLDQKTSNGAGKTSIFKIIYLAFYGEDIAGSKNVPKGNVVRRGSKTGGYLGATIKDQGVEYTIIRSIDYSGPQIKLFERDGKDVYLKKNDVYFAIDGVPFLGDSNTGTQKNIQSKIKISSKLFLNSILTAQDGKNNFLQADDTEKKKILTELLDLTKYDKGFKKIKEDIASLNKKVDIHSLQMDSLVSAKLTTNEDLDLLKEEEKKFEIEVEERKKTIIKDIDEKKLEIKKTKSDLGLITLPKIEDNQLEKEIKLSENISKYEEQAKKEKPLLEAKNKLENTLENLAKENKEVNIKISENKSLIESKEKDILDLKSTLIEVKDKSDLESKYNSLNKLKKEIDKKNLDYQNIKKDLDIKKTYIVKNESKIQENLKTIEEIKHKSSCPTCERNFEKGDSSFLEKSIGKYNQENDNLNNQIKNFKKESEELMSAMAEVQTFISKNENVEDDLNNISKDIQEIKLNEEKNNSIKKQASLIDKEKKSLDKSNDDLNDRLKTIPEESLRLDEKLKNVNNNLSKIDLIKSKLKELNDNLVELKNSSADYKVAIEKKNSLERLLSNLESNLRKLEDEKLNLDNRNNSSILLRKETLNKRLKSTEEKITVLKKKLTDFQNELKYLNFWKVGFSPTGIRSFITDDVIQLLNQKTQDNLDDLFDGALQVFFDPESKNTKNVISNKISTNFILNGEDCKWDELSGGEKQRAKLATELALNEIAEDYSGTIFNVKFLDEPFTGMDDIGQQKSLSLFNRLAEKKDFFGIISHSQTFQSLCPNKVYIIKKNKVSKIVSEQQYLSATSGGSSPMEEAPDETNKISDKNKFNYDI